MKPGSKIQRRSDLALRMSHSCRTAMAMGHANTRRRVPLCRANEPLARELVARCRGHRLSSSTPGLKHSLVRPRAHVAATRRPDGQLSCTGARAHANCLRTHRTRAVHWRAARRRTVQEEMRVGGGRLTDMLTNSPSASTSPVGADDRKIARVSERGPLVVPIDHLVESKHAGERR